MKLVNKYYDLFGVRTHKVKLLKKIIDKTGAKVVLSSSWRSGWYNPYDKQGLRVRILHKKFNRFGIKVFSVTAQIINGEGYLCRETEIRSWLLMHPEVNQFVVLDDEQYDLQGFIGRELVRTSETDCIQGSWYENTGLKMKHVNQAIKILSE